MESIGDLWQPSCESGGGGRKENKINEICEQIVRGERRMHSPPYTHAVCVRVSLSVCVFEN